MAYVPWISAAAGRQGSHAGNHTLSSGARPAPPVDAGDGPNVARATAKLPPLRLKCWLWSRLCQRGC